MFKFVLQLFVGIFTLVLSTLIAKYEGSAITYDSLEWGYSTPFTKLFKIEITSGSDISQLDYFVYAAKFQPLFPAIMMVSVFYILSIVGYYLIKNKPKLAIGFWGVIGSVMLLLSGFIINSSTIGGRIHFWIILVSGIISISVAAFVCLRNFKHNITVSTN